MRTQWNFCGEHPAKYGWVCAGILPKMSGDTESQKSTQCRGGVQIIFDCSSCQDDMHKSCEKCNKFQCSCMENPCTYREAFKVREKRAPAHRFKWGTVSCVRLREIVFSGYFPVNQFLRVMIRQSVFFTTRCRAVVFHPSLWTAVEFVNQMKLANVLGLWPATVSPSMS